MSQFSLSDENPNEITGGGGCLCHPRGSDETRGPFFIFTPTTTDDNLSPHAVLCAHCACDAKEDVLEHEEKAEPLTLEVIEEITLPPDDPDPDTELDKIPVIKI